MGSISEYANRWDSIIAYFYAIEYRSPKSFSLIPLEGPNLAGMGDFNKDILSCNLQIPCMNATVAGEQIPCRLPNFQENYTSRGYVSPKSLAIGTNEKVGIGGVKVGVIHDLKEEFTGAEIELVKKKLTRSDISSCTAYPTGNLRAIKMLRGRNAINFNARDPTGRVWEFKLCTRNHGRYKKPVVRGDWLKYVRAKGLTVNDFIILTMVEDAENRSTYNIRVEPSLKLAI